jgi:hypothetical protein
LEDFLISAGKTLSASILIGISIRNDSVIPIHGYRYIVMENGYVSFKENGVDVRGAIVGMSARSDDPEDIAEALSMPLAAAFESDSFLQNKWH